MKTEKDAFNEWAVKRGMDITADGRGVYYCSNTHSAWEGWQASRVRVKNEDQSNWVSCARIRSERGCK